MDSAVEVRAGLGGLVLAAVATGGVAATADTLAVLWQSNDVVGIDVGSLDMTYQGKIITAVILARVPVRPAGTCR